MGNILGRRRTKQRPLLNQYLFPSRHSLVSILLLPFLNRQMENSLPKLLDLMGEQAQMEDERPQTP